MLFVLIDSVLFGMTGHLERTLTGFDAPITIMTTADGSPEVLQDLRVYNTFHKTEHVMGEVTQFEGLVEVSGQTPIGLRVRAFDSGLFKIKSSQMQIFWDEGYDAENFSSQSSSNLILLGEELYKKLQFVPGEPQVVLITHPFADLGPSGEIEPASQEFHVVGLFTTGRTDFDDQYALIAPAGMSSLANLAMVENLVFFEMKREAAESTKIEILKNFPQYDGKIKTWLDRHAHLFKAIHLERLLYTGVMLFITIISSFNLAGVVSIFTLSKSRETAILKTLGFTNQRIVAVFSAQGFILGVVGSVFGVLLAMLLMFTFKKFDLQLPESYGFTELPMRLRWSTLAFLLIGTPLIGTLVSVFPAKRFSQAKIADTMRLG